MSAIYTKSDKQKLSRQGAKDKSGIRGDAMRSIMNEAFADARAATDALAQAEGRGRKKKKTEKKPLLQITNKSEDEISANRANNADRALGGTVYVGGYSNHTERSRSPQPGNDRKRSRSPRPNAALSNTASSVNTASNTASSSSSSSTGVTATARWPTGAELQKQAAEMKLIADKKAAERRLQRRQEAEKEFQALEVEFAGVKQLLITQLTDMTKPLNDDYTRQVIIKKEDMKGWDYIKKCRMNGWLCATGVKQGWFITRCDYGMFSGGMQKDAPLAYYIGGVI